MLAAVPARADAPTDDLAKPNPAAVTGRLANGLRYTILKHPSHGKEAIRLYIEAGSRDETDAERGVAHFIEHMAFVGPKDFPPGQLAQTFARAGIAWGSDQNAFTDYFGTLYALDIAEVGPAKMDLGFRWLANVADGLVFDPAAVDRERQVVLREYDRNQGPARDLQEKVARFLGPGLRGVERSPIGEPETLKAADAGRLKAFHDRWYRPENAVVIAVGDAPEDAVRQRIEAAFGAWRPAGPPTPRFPPGQIDPKRPSDMLAVTEPKLPGAVMVCRFAEIDPLRAEDVELHRVRLADFLWRTALERRFAALVLSKTPPVLNAGAAREEAFRAAAQTCFTAIPLNEDWRRALATITREARRLSAHGVTQAEFDYGKSQILASADLGVASEATREAAPLAAEILENYRLEGTFATASEDRRLQIAALARLDVAAVNAAFRRRWDAAGEPLVVVASPHPVTPVEVKSAWAAEQAAPLPPPPRTAAAAVWNYRSFGPPGTVVRREVMKDPDFVRLTFQNGVVVNFKQTNFSKDQVDIRARFGAGQQEVEPGHIPEAELGANTLLVGGLGRNSARDIIDVCEGHACSATLEFGRIAFDLKGSTRTEDLELELQLLAALLSDPGFSANMDKRIPSAVHGVYRQLNSNPMALAAKAWSEALPTPHVSDVPPEEVLAGTTARQIRRDLEGPLKTDALEITVVGDVEEARATELLAATFGALKPRERVDRTRPDAAHQRFAAQAPPRVVVRHDGPPDKAAILISWPLYVWTEEHQHEDRVLLLLAGVLRDRIIEQVRRRSGQTYTPQVQVSLGRGGDQGALTIAIETAPGAVDAVIDEVERIAAEVAEVAEPPKPEAKTPPPGAVTMAELGQVARPLIADNAQQRSYNSWWLAVLDGSLQYPDQLARTRSLNRDIARVTLGEVKTEARRWLLPKPLVVVALPKEGASAAPKRSPQDPPPEPAFPPAATIAPPRTAPAALSTSAPGGDTAI
jgi:zinc protease